MQKCFKHSEQTDRSEGTEGTYLSLCVSDVKNVCVATLMCRHIVCIYNKIIFIVIAHLLGESLRATNDYSFHSKYI